MANTITYETIFESVLQDRLARPQNWKEICDVVISDVRAISSSYDSDTGGFPTVQTVTRGTAFTIQDMAQTAETLTISTSRDLPIFVDLADLAQSPHTKPMEIFKRIGQRLGEFIETDVLAQHANWRNLGGSGGVWTDNTATTLAMGPGNIDDLIRLARRVVREQNGHAKMSENGLAFVHPPATFEFMEAFAQANGFDSADRALEKGLAPQVNYLGAIHYISNDNAANHMFAGVRKLERLGILRGTYGKSHTIPFPAGSSNNNLSGVAYYSRVDIGHLTPTTYNTNLFDVNIA